MTDPKTPQEWNEVVAIKEPSKKQALHGEAAPDGERNRLTTVQDYGRVRRHTAKGRRLMGIEARDLPVTL